MKNGKQPGEFLPDKDPRAWYCIYDLQGGPMPQKAINSLETYITKVAQKYNLAIDMRKE